MPAAEPKEQHPFNELIWLVFSIRILSREIRDICGFTCQGKARFARSPTGSQGAITTIATRGMSNDNSMLNTGFRRWRMPPFRFSDDLKDRSEEHTSELQSRQ